MGKVVVRHSSWYIFGALSTSYASSRVFLISTHYSQAPFSTSNTFAMPATLTSGGAGSAANDVLNDMLRARNVRWYKGRVGRLNFLMACLMVTMMNNGYDGSMMNGLQ